MHRIIAAGISVIVILAGALTSAAAAGEAPNMHADDGVLWPDCRFYAYAYDFELPADTAYWTARMVLLGPDGLKVDGDVLSESDGGATGHGGGKFFVCGGEEPGSYTITAVGTYTDSKLTYERHFEVPPAVFQLRLPRTRTGLSVRPATGKCVQAVTLGVTVKDERPAGYFSTRSADVRVQMFKANVWANIGRVTLTKRDRGHRVTAIRYNSCRPVRFRAVTQASGVYSSSSSAVLRVVR